jgi:hypothetical protein
MNILYPLFAMAALTFFCMFRLGYMRFTAVRRREVDFRFFRQYRDYDEPDDLRVMSRHVVNLYESPVLFYAITIIAFITETVSILILALAWAYVGLRCIHSYIHLTSNIVIHRFRVFVTSQVVLTALWIVVLLGLVP